jgi:hypothetical protein
MKVNHCSYRARIVNNNGEKSAPNVYTTTDKLGVMIHCKLNNSYICPDDSILTFLVM